jgi:ubiquitin-conjugating enzyme E2 A
MANQNNLRDKRLLKEFKECSLDDTDFTVSLINDDILNWNINFKGPINTLYEGGSYDLIIKYNLDYPFVPPKIKFITKILHPNIALDGEICLDILKFNWSPALSIAKVIISIISLLSDPNPRSPLNNDAAILYENDIESYNKQVKDYVLLYAIK